MVTTMVTTTMVLPMAMVKILPKLIEVLTKDM